MNKSKVFLYRNYLNTFSCMHLHFRDGREPKLSLDKHSIFHDLVLFALHFFFKFMEKKLKISQSSLLTLIFAKRRAIMDITWTNERAVWHAYKSYGMHFWTFEIHNPLDRSHSVFGRNAMRKLTTRLSARILHVRKSLVPSSPGHSILLCCCVQCTRCVRHATNLFWKIGVQELG